MRQDSIVRSLSGVGIHRQSTTGEGVVVIDLALQPLALDRGAEAILRQLDDQRFGGAPARLPPALQNLLAARPRAEWGSIKLHLTADTCQYSCRVFLMEPRNSLTTQPMVALYLKREVSMSEAVLRVAQAYHLTEREQETLIGVSMGLTSKELAERMSISPNTVNAFVRLIMVKMGVTTRAGVVGRLLESNGDSPGSKTVGRL